MSETTSTTGTQTLSLQSETVDPSNTGDPSETTVTAPAADTTDAALSAPGDGDASRIGQG
jgi:hypothetical protein